MVSKLAAFAVKVAIYGVKNIYPAQISKAPLSALTLPTIQARQAPIHDDGGLGAALGT